MLDSHCSYALLLMLSTLMPACPCTFAPSSLLHPHGFSHPTSHLVELSLPNICTCNRTKIKFCFNLLYRNSFRLVKSYVESLERWRTVICIVQIHHGGVDLLLLLPHCSFPCTLQNFKLSS